MVEIDGSGELPQRHFWRRALAFLLDAIIATLIITLLFSGIRAVTGMDLGTPSLASSTTSQCDTAPANHAQVIRVEGMWPLASGETRQNILCTITHNGSKLPLLFVTRVVSQSGTMTYTREASYPVDSNGQPVAVEYPMDWSPIAYLAIFVAFAAQGRRTPGKASMGLWATTEAGGNLGWPDAFKREALKFLPFLLYFAFALWIAIDPPSLMTDSEAILVAIRDGGLLTSPYMILSIVLGVGTLVWWFGPFLIWRGRTWYDALAGTKVVRTDRQHTTARPQA